MCLLAASFEVPELAAVSGLPIQVVRADDTPRPMHIGGRAGAAIKNMVCTMAIDVPMKESSTPGAYRWPKGPKAEVAA